MGYAPENIERRCKYCGTTNRDNFNRFNVTLCITCGEKVKKLRAMRAPKKYCKICHGYIFEEFFREKDSDTCITCYNNGYYDHDIWNVDESSKKNNMDDIIRKAKEMGISYGQYVARYGNN